MLDSVTTVAVVSGSGVRCMHATVPVASAAGSRDLPGLAGAADAVRGQPSGTVLSGRRRRAAGQDEGVVVSSDGKRRAPLVFDVGAHEGEDTGFYLDLGYDVVAVEANPRLAAGLETRFASEVAAGRLHVVAAAVSDAPGPLRFFVNDTLSVWGTTSVERARRNEQLGTSNVEVEVPTRSLRSLVAEFGVPAVLKVDIEGGDLECVSGLAGCVDRPAFLSMEATETDFAALVAEFDMLESLGYRRFKVVRQGVHRVRGLRWRHTNGSMIVHRFSTASSGPLPPQTRGRWLSRDEALAKYRRVYFVYRHFGTESRLQQALARWPLARRAVGFAVGWYDTHAYHEKLTAPPPPSP